MATRFEPYYEKDRWWIDKDPDDKLYYVADVRQALIDANTTVASFTAVVQGVEVLEKGAPQGEFGGLLPVKLGGMGKTSEESFCTFRVTCANSEQFDRTLWFKRVEN